MPDEISYTDTYLTGNPVRLQAVIALALEAGHSVIPMTVLDGIGQVCIRTEAPSLPLVPEGADYTLADLTQYPQTAQVVVGAFMADPVPPEFPQEELPFEEGEGES